MNLLKQSMLPLLVGISLASASACSDDSEDGGGGGGETVFQLVGGGTSCDNNGGPTLFEIYIGQNGESPIRVTLELAGPEGQNQELHNAAMVAPEGGNERWAISLSEVQSPNLVVLDESTLFGCRSEGFWKFTAYDTAGNWQCYRSDSQEGPFADDCRSPVF